MERKTSASPNNDEYHTPVEETKSSSSNTSTNVTEDKDAVDALDAQKSKAKLLCYNVFVPPKECIPVGVESKRFSTEAQSDDDDYYDDDDDENPMQIDESASADSSPTDINSGQQLLKRELLIKPEINHQDTYRVQKRRETNRKAAQKCRQKQTEREAILRQEFFETESRNTRLHYEIMQLQKSKELLEKILHNHHCVYKKDRISPEGEESPVNMVKDPETIRPVEIVPIPSTAEENVGIDPRTKPMNTMDTPPCTTVVEPISIEPSYSTAVDMTNKPTTSVGPITIQPSYNSVVNAIDKPTTSTIPITIQPSYNSVVNTMDKPTTSTIPISIQPRHNSDDHVMDNPTTSKEPISIQPSCNGVVHAHAIEKQIKTFVGPISIQPSYNNVNVRDRPTTNIGSISIQQSYHSVVNTMDKQPKTIVGPISIQPSYNRVLNELDKQPKTSATPISIQPSYNTAIPTFISSPSPQPSSQPFTHLPTQPQPLVTPDGFKIPQSVPRKKRSSKVIKQINAEELKRILEKGGKMVPVTDDDINRSMALKQSKLKAIYSNKPPAGSEILSLFSDKTEKSEKEQRKEKDRKKKNRKPLPTTAVYKPQFILPKAMPGTHINSKQISKEELEEMKKAQARTSIAATALLELNLHGSERVHKNFYEIQKFPPSQQKFTANQFIGKSVLQSAPKSVLQSAQQEIINNVTKAIFAEETTKSGSNFSGQQSFSNSTSHPEKNIILQSNLIQNVLNSRGDTKNEFPSSNNIPQHEKSLDEHQSLTNNSSQSRDYIMKQQSILLSSPLRITNEINLTKRQRLAYSDNCVPKSENDISKQNDSSSSIIRESTTNISQISNDHKGPVYMKRRDFHIQNELKRTANETLESVQSPRIISTKSTEV